MRLTDVNRDTEGTFLRCLHDERPDDPRVAELRRRWFETHRDRGLRARVLVLDTGEVAGLCQYVPVEHSHVVGEDMLVILCMWVHGYEHHIGNRQGNGYGRYMLESIESDARESGVSALVAWGMDFPYWNPVSFYEHMGFSRVDKSGMAVLVWKPFREGVAEPGFLRQARRPVTETSKISVVAFLNGWCMGSCSQCVMAREAVDGLEDVVDYMEVDASDRDARRSWGISDGVYVEGEPYRACEPPFSSDVLRRDLLELAGKRNGSGGETATRAR